MRILVTGGAGYIGSHTCKALAEAGHVAIAYDNLSTGHRHAVRYGPLVEAQLSDTAKLISVLIDKGIEAVLHFAACAYVSESCADPGLYYQNNVVGTLSLLQAMRRAKVSMLVFSSTCATFGPPKVERIDEDQPQYPQSPYGASKWMCERIIGDFAAAYGLRSVILRYFNAAGADADGEIGEEHDPETHLIPLALAAAERGATFTVHGHDYPTFDGTCVRDYVHVSDLAQAHLQALAYLRPRPAGAVHAFHLGTGMGVSVQQVLACVRSVTQQSPNVVLGPRRPGDAPSLVADSRRARAELGWAPLHTQLSDMVRSAYRWRRRQSNRVEGHRRPESHRRAEAHAHNSGGKAPPEPLAPAP